MNQAYDEGIAYCTCFYRYINQMLANGRGC